MPVTVLPDEDAALVAAARTGDQDAYARLFDRWFDPCYDIARRIVRDDGRAGEVAQDALLTAWTNLDTLQDPAAFGSWVRRIARNRALNRLEKERRAMATDHESPVLAMLAAPVDVADQVARQAHGDLVWAAAQALGERDASVLDLHIRHGLDATELAGELEVTPNNASQILFRMKARLATAIRAWVLYRGGSPTCPVLAAELAGAGTTAFGPAAVRVIDGHRHGCDVCEPEQASALSPEVLFASVPFLVAPVAVRQAAQGAGAGAGGATSPDPVATPSGAAGDHGAPPAAENGAPAPTPPATGHGGGRTRPGGTAPSTGLSRHLPLVAAAAVAVAVVVAMAVVVGRAGGPAPTEAAAPPTTRAGATSSTVAAAPAATPVDDEVGVTPAAEGSEAAEAPVPTTTPVAAPPAGPAGGVTTPAGPARDGDAPPAGPAEGSASVASPTTVPPSQPQPTGPSPEPPGLPPAPPAEPLVLPPPPPPAPAVDEVVVTPAGAPGGACPVGLWATTVAWQAPGATSVTISAVGVPPFTSAAAVGNRVFCRPTPSAPPGGWTLTATGPGGSTTVSAT